MANSLVVKVDIDDDGTIMYHRHPDFSYYYMKFHKQIIMKIPVTMYVMHVGYSNGNMQLGVSGARKHGESYDEAAKREAWEEMGIGFRKWFFLESFSGKGRPHIYMVNADDYYVPTNVTLDTRTDDRKRKISIIICGTRDKLIEIMRIAKPQDPNEKITYYSAVPVSLLQTEYAKK